MTPMNGSDQLLARIAQNTATEVDWQALVERHGDGMRRAAILAIGPTPLADDAVQEALLQLRHCAGRFSLRGTEVEKDARRWLQGLTVNCALSLRRSEIRRHRRELTASLKKATDGDSENQGMREHLSEALGELKPEEREILVLRHIDGMDHSSLAHALGINEATARKRLSRIHERLRQRLRHTAVSISGLALTECLDAAGAIQLPAPPIAAWAQSAAMGTSPTISFHFATKRISTMAHITTAISIGALVSVFTIGYVGTTGASKPGPVTMPKTTPMADTPAPAPVVAQPAMQKITTFLMFEGKAGDAIKLYTSAFPNSAIKSISHYGESDGEFAGTVRHAVVTLNGQDFMFIDSYVKHAFTFTPATSLYVTCRTVDEVDALFTTLSAGGQVLMPLDSYPFSKRYAWFSDQFGVSWQVALADE
jgi:RNA polymerase sigma factor (sigma-70 family)